MDIIREELTAGLPNVRRLAHAFMRLTTAARPERRADATRAAGIVGKDD